MARLIRDDGLAGMTSNPAIFEKAISSGREYDEPLARLVRSGEDRPEEIYESLAVGDIRAIKANLSDRPDLMDCIGAMAGTMAALRARNNATTVQAIETETANKIDSQPEN